MRSVSFDRIIYPGIVLFCIIIIWIGSNNLFSTVLGVGDAKSCTSGGVTLLVGILIAGGIHLLSKKKKPNA